jgi:hypothetical protein
MFRFLSVHEPQVFLPVTVPVPERAFASRNALCPVTPDKSARRLPFAQFRFQDCPSGSASPLYELIHVGIVDQLPPRSFFQQAKNPFDVLRRLIGRLRDVFHGALLEYAVSVTIGLTPKISADDRQPSTGVRHQPLMRDLPIETKAEFAGEYQFLR